MELYSSNKDYKLYKGSMLDMLEHIDENSIDSIVCDPPYELNFMNKGWDNSGIAFNKETWERCFKVLKPGGHLLAFGGSRTYHRIACAIEDAGFEIRDCMMYLYGSGFPKSMNIGLMIDKKNGVDNRTGNIRNDGSATGSIVTTGVGNLKQVYEERKAQNEWSGWGTQLKPAYEPIIVARKPCEGSIIDNVLKYGVGGINIDECRVPAKQGEYDIRHYTNEDCFQNLKPKESKYQVEPQPDGRFPANVIHDGSDEAISGMPDTNGGSKLIRNYEVNRVGLTEDNPVFNTKTSGFKTNLKNDSISSYGDEGNASRYFYCAKASEKDRDEGCEQINTRLFHRVNSGGLENEERFKPIPRKNIHPTVKPTELMQYLVRLVSPKGATILDPFNGSGSTGKAVMFENKERDANYKYIGIELTDEYLPIAKARIEYVCNNDFDFYKKNKDDIISEHEIRVKTNQTDIFDFLK